MKQETMVDLLTLVGAELERRGIKGATIQGGGAGWPWLEVKIDDKRTVTFGTANGTWAGEVYPDAEAMENGLTYGAFDTELEEHTNDVDAICDAFVVALPADVADVHEIHQARLDARLRKVQETQTAFWDALRELEEEIGGDAELSGETDYEGYSVDDLPSGDHLADDEG